METLKNNDLGYDFIIENDNYEQIKEKIENNDIDSAIIIAKENNDVKMTYVVETVDITTIIPEDIMNRSHYP